MTVTLHEIVLAEPALNKLVTVDLPVRTAYRLTKLLGKVASELKVYEESRKKMFTKYGEADAEKPEMMRIKEEHFETFASEMNSLLSESVEIPLWKIKLEDLGDAKLTTMEMATLLPFVEDEEVPAEDPKPVVQ